MAEFFRRISGFLGNGLVSILSRMSFSVTSRQGVSIPVFPVLYSAFYGNFFDFLRSCGPEGRKAKRNVGACSLRFSILYQMESAFINLLLLNMGLVFRILYALFDRNYLRELDRPGEPGAETYLFHNYIGARTLLLFFMAKSIMRGESNVLFADSQVFGLLKRFKQYLSKGAAPGDPEGKAVIANSLFGKWTRNGQKGGEQVILNSAHPWNMISACKYVRKKYRMLLIPENKTDAGHTVSVRLLESEMRLPEGALWLMRHTDTAVSVAPEKQILFLPFKIRAEEYRTTGTAADGELYGDIIRKQEEYIKARPYRYVPFLYTPLWKKTAGGADPRVLVKMTWKRKKLLFYEGGGVGYISDNTKQAAS